MKTRFAGQLVRLTHRSDGNNACIFVTLCFAHQYEPKKGFVRI